MHCAAYPENHHPLREILIASDSPDDILATLGSELWNATFGANTELERLLLSALDSDNRVRLIIACKDVRNDARLTGLAWECLRIPSLRVFTGLTLKLSIVRDLPEPAALVRRRIGTPLRILIAAASPSDAPLPSLATEMETLRQVLEPAVRSSAVVFETLQQATIEELRRSLRRFQPRIFHFMGHGITEGDGGSLTLCAENGDAEKISTTSVGTILQD